MAVTLTDEQVHNIAASLRNVADLLDPPAEPSEDQDQTEDSQPFVPPARWNV